MSHEDRAEGEPQQVSKPSKLASNFLARNITRKKDHGSRERAERLELFARNVPELLAVVAVDGTIEPTQQLESRIGDCGGDHPPIARISDASDESTLLEPIQQAREIGIAGQHAL